MHAAEVRALSTFQGHLTGHSSHVKVMDDDTLEGPYSDAESVSTAQSTGIGASGKAPPERGLQAETIEVQESSLAAAAMKPSPSDVEVAGPMVRVDEGDYIVEEVVEPQGMKFRANGISPRSGLSPPSVFEQLNMAGQADNHAASNVNVNGSGGGKGKACRVCESDSSNDSDGTSESMASATRRYNKIAATYGSMESDSDE